MAFTALGATGSSAAIIDDVLALALGLDVTPTTCVVAPPPASRRRRRPPATATSSVSTVSSRHASTPPTPWSLAIAARDGSGVELVTVDADHVRTDQSRPVAALDPGSPYRRLVIDLPADAFGSFGVGAETNRSSFGVGAGTNRGRRGRAGRASPAAAGGARPPADRRRALDARRGPSPRRRPRAVRSVGGLVPGRAAQARRVARGDRRRRLGRRTPATTTSIRCWPRSPSRSPARRRARPRPTPSRCSPASASRPTTSSTAG